MLRWVDGVDGEVAVEKDELARESSSEGRQDPLHNPGFSSRLQRLPTSPEVTRPLDHSILTYAL
jgi:hypothetical protein